MAHNCLNSSSREIWYTPLAFVAMRYTGVYRHTCRQNIHTHEVKIKTESAGWLKIPFKKQEEEEEYHNCSRISDIDLCLLE